MEAQNARLHLTLTRTQTTEMDGHVWFGDQLLISFRLTLHDDEFMEDSFLFLEEHLSELIHGAPWEDRLHQHVTECMCETPSSRWSIIIRPNLRHVARPVYLKGIDEN